MKCLTEIPTEYTQPKVMVEECYHFTESILEKKEYESMKWNYVFDG